MFNVIAVTKFPASPLDEKGMTPVSTRSSLSSMNKDIIWSPSSPHVQKKNRILSIFFKYRVHESIETCVYLNLERFIKVRLLVFRLFNCLPSCMCYHSFRSSWLFPNCVSILLFIISFSLQGGISFTCTVMSHVLCLFQDRKEFCTDKLLWDISLHNSPQTYRRKIPCSGSVSPPIVL